MKKIHIILLISVLAVILVAVLTIIFCYKFNFYQNTYYSDSLSARDVVKKYIDLQMRGATLYGLTNQKTEDITQYYTIDFARLDINYLEVINGYDIVSEANTGNTSYIVVNFYCDKIVAVEGQYPQFKNRVIKSQSDSRSAFVEITCSDFFKDHDNFSNNIETVRFELLRDGNAWKLNGPGIEPHILRATLDAYLAQ